MIITNNLSKRPNYLDLAKVIMIYLVVLGHYAIVLEIPFDTNPLWEFTHFITLFHMPFFFLISGILFKNEGFAITLKKGWKQLLVPYFLMALICLALMTLIDIINLNFSYYKTIHIVIGILTGSDSRWGHDPYADPLWFCYSLFIIKLLASICCGIKKIKWGGHFVVITLGLVIMQLDIKMPFRIDSSLVGYIFFSGGYFIKNKVIKLFDTFKSALWVTIVCFLLLLVPAFVNLDFSSYNGGLSINAMKFGMHPMLFILSGYAGSFMVIGLSRALPLLHRELILVVSSGTIIVLGFHWLIFILFVKPWCYCDSLFIAFLVSFFVLVICGILIRLSVKYFPALLGNRRLY